MCLLHVGERIRFSNQQKTILLNFFFYNQYPSKKEKEALSTSLKLTLSQLSKWFDIQRQKLKKGNETVLAEVGETIL